MTELSPSAQTVLDAANMVFSQAGTTAQGIAAALCAAADQVVPEESEPFEQTPFVDDDDRWSIWNANQKTRRKFLAIATELEGFND
jgi:hypothetical protein